MAGQFLFAVLVWGSIAAVLGAFGYEVWLLTTAWQ
jgi:hypothetical protein